MAEYNPLARRTRAKHTSQWLLQKSGRELLVYHSAWDKPYSQKNTTDANEIPYKENTIELGPNRPQARS